MDNRVTTKLRSGGVSVGAWMDWFAPDIVEVCGYLGFEYAVIDGEHSVLDHALASEMIRACDAVGMVPIVRIPEINRSSILRYLDMGALGIYVPHVNTAAEARTIVDAVKYAPLGHRGAGSTRAVQFGLTQPLPEMYRLANENTMVVVLIEESKGIRNLKEILSVGGIDVFAIGAGDLSHSMGHVGQKDHPEVQRVAKKAEATIRAAGHAFESTVSSLGEAQEAIDRGGRMISLSIRPMVVRAGRDFLAGLADPATQLRG